jgi:hypothetical protein
MLSGQIDFKTYAFIESYLITTHNLTLMLLDNVISPNKSEYVIKFLIVKFMYVK